MITSESRNAGNDEQTEIESVLTISDQSDTSDRIDPTNLVRIMLNYACTVARCSSATCGIYALQARNYCTDAYMMLSQPESLEQTVDYTKKHPNTSKIVAATSAFRDTLSTENPPASRDASNRCVFKRNCNHFTVFQIEILCMYCTVLLFIKHVRTNMCL